jgi:hypothetical protein
MIRILLKIIERTLLCGLWLVTVSGFYYLLRLPVLAASIIFVSLPGIWWRLKWARWIEIGIVILLALLVFRVTKLVPSDDRVWAIDKSLLPIIEFKGDNITIKHLRNFKWYADEKYDAIWKTETFNLNDLDRLELIVEPFRDSKLLAHTMLDFGFRDGRQVIVSVEARNEKDENYGLFPGTLRQFELIYIFGDEHDFLTLRAVQRKAHVYLYPIKANKDFIRDLFIDLANGANKLHSTPRFYRTIFDNCTTTLVKHADRISTKKIGLRYETLFPSLTGKLLYDKGFIDTTLGYEEAKAHFRVDEKIITYVYSPDFSKMIRK